MADRRNILYVLASPTWGGGEQYVYDLVRNLPRVEYECWAVTPKSEVNMRKMLEVVGPGRVFELRMGSLFDIGSARRVASIIKDKGIDIVHVNKFSDAFLAVWARKMSGRSVRIVMTRHLIRKGKTGSLYRYLYRRLDRMVFVSELALNEFRSRGAEVDPSKVRVIHNGIPDAPQDPSARSCGSVTIAFVGRVVPEKGLDVLLEALSGLAHLNFRLKITGAGEQEYIDELKHIATRGGLAQKVVFAGFTGDVNQALQEAEIGVLPSVVREGFPISVLEYMRSGLAVVASDNGGQAECLTGGKDSFLVPAGDSERLAEALKALLEDPARRGQMGREARKAFLAHLTYERFLGEMTKLYDGL